MGTSRVQLSEHSKQVAVFPLCYKAKILPGWHSEVMELYTPLLKHGPTWAWGFTNQKKCSIRQAKCCTLTTGHNIYLFIHSISLLNTREFSKLHILKCYMQEVLGFECSWSRGFEGLHALLALYILHCHSNRSTTAQHFLLQLAPKLNHYCEWLMVPQCVKRSYIMRLFKSSWHLFNCWVTISLVANYLPACSSEPILCKVAETTSHNLARHTHTCYTTLASKHLCQFFIRE